MIDINGWEFLILILLAIIILGPERLPAYAAKLGRFVRQAKAMAERAKTQFKDEMGPEFTDIDWRAYDPRQYDPRRIVREALSTPEPGPTGTEPVTLPAAVVHDPGRPTPWDNEAT